VTAAIQANWRTDMNMNSTVTRASRCALAFSLCWTTAGCGEAPLEPAAESTAMTVSATAPSSPSPNTPAPLTLGATEPAIGSMTPVAPELAPVAPTKGAEPPAPVADYQPPFPDRVDLFVAPKREGGAHASGESVSVELLGFVEVDQPRAVLSINGQVTPIAAGGVESGVEVISIQPPMVLLQRGRQRWQATLEN
jgi:hypothetical protein